MFPTWYRSSSLSTSIGWYCNEYFQSWGAPSPIRPTSPNQSGCCIFILLKFIVQSPAIFLRKHRMSPFYVFPPYYPTYVFKVLTINSDMSPNVNVEWIFVWYQRAPRSSSRSPWSFWCYSAAVCKTRWLFLHESLPRFDADNSLIPS